MTSRKRSSSGGKRQKTGPDRAQQSTIRHARPALPLWKKLVFSSVIVVVLFALAEAGCFLAGIEPVVRDEDPFVGFVGSMPLFGEQRGPDGDMVMVTRKNKLSKFNKQQFAREKQSGAYRIFCLGGSTTYGRPYDDVTSFSGWLRELLPLADPSRDWEVVNAGGISYASYRVAIVMEELCRYEPDLFIIYTGHNEFLEERTYGEFRHGGPLGTRLQSAASRTRIYAALDRLIGSAARGGRTSVPDKPLLEAEVDALLDESIGPEDYHRDDAQQRKVIDHFRYNLTRMIDMGRAAGAEVVLVTPASNLRDSSPFKSELSGELIRAELQQLGRLMQQAEQAKAEERFQGALALLDQAATVDARYAHLHFMRGQLLGSLGRNDEAERAYVRARDEDICPLRALSEMVRITGEVASEKEAPLVDFARMVESASPDGIPGREIFLDHVHPTIDGHGRLAWELVATLAARGAVRLPADWGQRQYEQVSRAIVDRCDPDYQGQALLKLARVLGWAGKHEEAYRLAQQGLELVPDDPLGLGQAGTRAHVLGRYGEAESYFRRAVAVSPDDPSPHVGLGLALRDLGRSQEALAAFEQALQLGGEEVTTRINLGSTLLLMQRFDDGLAQLRRAHQLDPRRRKTVQALASALASRGRELTAENRYHEASAHLRESLQLLPQDPRARHALALALEGEGRLHEASAEALAALAAARERGDRDLVAAIQRDLQRVQAAAQGRAD